jgi:hypothetical protein
MDCRRRLTAESTLIGGCVSEATIGLTDRVQVTQRSALTLNLQYMFQPLARLPVSSRRTS